VSRNHPELLTLESMVMKVAYDAMLVGWRASHLKYKMGVDL